jgi:hypothetical protein
MFFPINVLLYKGVVGDFVWLDDDSDGNQDLVNLG